MKRLIILFILIFASNCFASSNLRVEYPKFKAFASDGTLASGYKLYTYESGTSTPITTYSDVDLTSANTNPIILDSVGEADVYVADAIKMVLKTDADVTVWTVDGIETTALAATSVSFDNTGTSLTADDVQEAIEEVEGRVSSVTAGVNVNRVLNPEMMIDQRNEGAATTATGTYTVDRWYKEWVDTDQLTVSAARTTGIGDYRYSNKFTVSNLEGDLTDASEEVAPFIYKFLGYDVADLAGETVTISFYFKSNAPSGSLFTTALVAGDEGYSFVTEFTYDATATVQFVTETITISSSNVITNTTTGTGLQLYIAAVGGSDYYASSADAWVPAGTSKSITTSTATEWTDTTSNYVQISGVALHTGSSSLSLPLKSYSDYLDDCVPYYRKSFDQGVAPAQALTDTAGAIIYVVPVTSQPMRVNIPFSKMMVGTPTVTYYSYGEATTAWWNLTDGAASGASSTTGEGTSGFVANNISAGTDDAGEQCIIHWAADAEL